MRGVYDETNDVTRVGEWERHIRERHIRERGNRRGIGTAQTSY